MTEPSRRRRRRPGAPESAEESQHPSGRAGDDHGADEDLVAGFPPAAPTRRTTPPKTTELLGAPAGPELDDDQARRVPVERDRLGKVTELVEADDATAAEHWDERLWKR